MAIKKLNEGPVIMVVTEAQLVDGNYGTQVQFVGQEEGAEEDTVLYISERSAIRQLERLGLSVDSCSGIEMKFEQVQKDGRTYNNIYRNDPSQGSTPKAAPAQPAAQAPRPAAKSGPASIDDTLALYERCLSSAAKTVLTMSEETGVVVSGSDIVAAAATLFIQANRR